MYKRIYKLYKFFLMMCIASSNKQSHFKYTYYQSILGLISHIIVIPQLIFIIVLTNLFQLNKDNIIVFSYKKTLLI